MPDGERVRSWRPDVPGVAEVLHARFTEHAYPLHTHDTWTVLLVDEGTVAYDLDHRARTTTPSLVTLLPPHVPHDGRAASAQGFRKRVLYLEPDVLPVSLSGAAVDAPVLLDPGVGRAVSRLHAALVVPGEELEAASRTALLTAGLRTLLARRGTPPPPRPDPSLARRLRDLLDADVVAGVTLAEASAALQADPAHLVRAFRTEFGLPPHRYLTGRRVDRARRMLLAGVPPAEAAVLAGFYDQSHLTRHFRRVLGAPPGRFGTRR
ncbi:helix-turn-helix domain-containing protein [Kineococcus rubinsiae]|uniref:helix-turn-helix domain-containing protein n=1 Tax=Kineococcus rubinsiae TaxID=2609562 RepID=UPI00142FE61C|nr:AraC family transcriptional regulator [Kineococcus rubinsiae]NIZ91819.1 AraC family transcriptional regulator [Kineococcus rubinsiae]